MRARVLTVDDEPLNLATIESFLEEDGYELRFSANGREALEEARRWLPDLILLDVMMPELDGFEVCRRIRADRELKLIPIIMVTALDDEKSRLEGLRCGADDFLTKPCRRLELKARVRTVASLNRFRALAHQRVQFQELYELAPSGIVLVEAGGRVIRANPQAETLLASDPVRPLTEDLLWSRFDTESAELVRLAVKEALGDEQGLPREVRCGSGKNERIMRLRGVLVPEGDTQLAMLSFDNVTEEVRARRELEELNRNLDELVSERTQELEEANGLLMSYAGFVSHDLRSPLTVVKGYLSMLHEGIVPLNPDAASLVARSYEATLRMQELIDNILQLARNEHQGSAANQAAVRVKPAPIISRVWEHLNELHSHTARRFIISDLPDVGVSGVVVERVFYNLLANAAKFSAHLSNPLIEVGAVPSAASPTLFVRDNGVGFDSRESEQLFREFSRLGTAAKTEGFGLGLSLIAKVVRAQGGRIWAESTVGAGATFFVEFPPPAVGTRPERGLVGTPA